MNVTHEFDFFVLSAVLVTNNKCKIAYKQFLLFSHAFSAQLKKESEVALLKHHNVTFWCKFFVDKYRL